MSYLSRYRVGEHQTVWRELIEAREAVFAEPLRSDAWGVARETMERVRQNLELLHGRLVELGFEFADPDQALVLADSGVGARLDELEREYGRLPLSARAFYETFACVHFEQAIGQLEGNAGPVDLHGLGSHAALVVRGFEEGIAAWKQYAAEVDSDDEGEDDDYPPMLFVGPVLSNCEQAHFELGAHAMDDTAFGADGREDASFVSHLRGCIEHGGFPFWHHLLRVYPEGVSWIPRPNVERLYPLLREGLLEL